MDSLIYFKVADANLEVTELLQGIWESISTCAFYQQNEKYTSYYMEVFFFNIERVSSPLKRVENHGLKYVLMCYWKKWGLKETREGSQKGEERE